MAQHIQHRRGTSTRWYDVNPILMDGELGYEKNTGKYKVGDGITAWNDLVYSSGIQGIQGIQGETGADSVVPGPQGIQGETGADSIVPGPTGPASAWGTIPGTLADQTDLNSALSGKATSAQGALADNAVPKSAYTAANDILVGTGASVVLKKTPTEIRAILNVADGANITAAANIPDNSIVRGNGGVKGIQGSGVTIEDDSRIGIENSSSPNDTPQTLQHWRAGVDATLGTMGMSLIVNPSAVGANRYAELGVGDAAAYRKLKITAEPLELLLGQIKFPAVQNPSSDANTLDDYEEGMWDPRLGTTGVGFASVTINAGVYGKYCKVGNLVHIQGFISTDAATLGSASGFITLINLPFVGSNVGFQSLSVSYAGAWATNNPNKITIIPGTNLGYLYYQTASNGTSLQLDVTGIATGGNSNNIYFSGSYFV